MRDSIVKSRLLIPDIQRVNKFNNYIASRSRYPIWVRKSNESRDILNQMRDSIAMGLLVSQDFQGVKIINNHLAGGSRDPIWDKKFSDSGDPTSWLSYSRNI